VWEFDITRSRDIRRDRKETRHHIIYTDLYTTIIAVKRIKCDEIICFTTAILLLTMLHSWPKKQWLHSSLHITSPLLTPRHRCWLQQRPRIEFPHALLSIAMRVFYMIAVGLYVVDVDIAAAAAAAVG
jgi:hypothetical protein